MREDTKRQINSAADISRRTGDVGEDSPEKKNKARKALVYVWTCVGAVILAGVIVYLLNVFALPVSVLIWTLLIVFCLRGIVSGLEARGIGRLAGTTIAYLVMIVFIALIVLIMFSPMFGLNDQFVNIASSLPGYVDSISSWFEGVAAKYSNLLDNQTLKTFFDNVGSSLSDWASTAASNVAGMAVNLGAAIVNTIYAVGFALVIAFWVLMELPAIGREFKRLMNPKHVEESVFLHVTFTRILGGYIKGMIIQCFIIGIGCGILFGVAGIPNAPALGVITGILNIIPIIGPWLGGAVAAILAVFVSPVTAILAFVGTIVIQQFVYTFVSPKIMQNSVDIHPALTLIAMILGSAIGGAMSGIMGSLVGMLIAIPSVAVIKALFIYYFERATGRQIVSEDGVIFRGLPKPNGVADPLYDATGGKANNTDKTNNADNANNTGSTNEEGGDSKLGSMIERARLRLRRK